MMKMSQQIERALLLNTLRVFRGVDSEQATTFAALPLAVCSLATS
jgi:hypothetical protein